MSFWPSIAALSLAQAALVGVPARAPAWIRWVERRRSGWWALLLPGSIVVVIAALTAAPGLADGLTYLALFGVPPLAAIALATLVRGSRPSYAVGVIPLFALAWLSRGTLLGEASALVLSALACVCLASALVALAPRRWVRAGIYAMAVVDTVLVTADLLQQPNAVLERAAPAAGLPQLQSVVFGSATMGFGDLFIAATLGALLAAGGWHRGRAVSIAAAFGLAFDLLFTLVNLLPTTVPIALTLAVLDRREPRATPAWRREPLALDPYTPIDRGVSRRVPG
jgi:hypothetical protein